MAVSKVDLVVLASVQEQPLHGYELLERLRARATTRWVEVGKASVYQALHRLDRDGLITGRDQEGTGGPDRRVYRITRAGRVRLRAGLSERLSATGIYETAAGPALGFAHLMPRAEVRRALEARGRALRELIEALGLDAEAVDASEPGGAVARAMLERQIALAEAEVEWIDASRSSLGHGPVGSRP
jgi:DNA-binding PadR family transcriptional regulator